MVFCHLNYFLNQGKISQYKTQFLESYLTLYLFLWGSIFQATFWCFPNSGKAKQNTDTGPEAGRESDLRP